MMSAELVLALAQVALVLVAAAGACLVLRRRVITRRGRLASSGEADWLGPGTMIVTCQAQPRPTRCADPDVIMLAMTQGALTGYLAWLEAAPPNYLSVAS
jgi:hypothetical protein